MPPVRWAEASAESELLVDHARSVRDRVQGQRSEIAARLTEARLLRGELNQLIQELHGFVGREPSL